MNRKNKALVLLSALLVFAVTGCLFRHMIGGLIIEIRIGGFDPAKVPPAPDYAQESSWAALPGKDNASDRVPAGFVETASPTHDLVDVFYIHPTGYTGVSNWNATVGEEAHYGIPTSVMLAGQASAFNGCGRVYAPEYRQASILAFIAPYIAPQRNDAFSALDLAYSDVSRAFDYFIGHYSQGRPFIIAGHSQGAMHALRLLAEKIDNTPLYDRLIAAYVIGGGVKRDCFQRVYQHVAPCGSPTQTGCLIAWDTVKEKCWVPVLGFQRYTEGWKCCRGKTLFCVNPLTWTPTEERADADAHLGALMASLVPPSANPDGCELKGISQHHTWAQCHEGRLWVAEQPKGPFYDRFGIYHLFDFGLFWMNIRENARARAETYLRAHGLPGTPVQ